MSDVKRYATLVLLVVAVFALVGVGTGLTGYVSTDWMTGLFVDRAVDSTAPAFVDFVVLQGALFAFFVGPSVGALTGLLAGVSLRNDPPGAAAVSLVGTSLGFYVMVFAAVFLLVLALDGASGSAVANGTAPTGGGPPGTTPTSDEFVDSVTAVRILEAGIPTGLVGTLGGLVGTRFFG